MGHEKMNWTASEIRLLRYRMGWSQAELARCLHLDLTTVTGWESGLDQPQGVQCSELLRILHQVEDHSEKMHRLPIAEVIMRDQGLSQVHDLEVDGVNEIPCAANKARASST